MIERMFDSAQLGSGDRPTVLEQRLGEWLEAAAPLRLEVVVPRRSVMVELEPHGEPAARPALSSTPAARSNSLEPELEPETAAFAGLLEAGAAHLQRAREARRAQSREAAVQARALAAFAAARPVGALDRPDNEVGAAAAASRAARPAALTTVSEWAVDEVMVALGLSAQAASAVLAESVTLVELLPATLTALEQATISWAHARMLTEVLAPITDAGIRAEVEARVLARAAGKTVSALRVAAKRAVLHADAAAAARRLAAAVRDRTVRGFPGEDGMGSLTATLPLPVLRACLRTLEAYAADCATPGDERTTDQRMVDCLVDLILRPDASGRPPVQAQLTVVASVDTLTGGDEPGEVDGQPVPALLVRELAHTLGLLPRPEPTPVTSSPATSHPAASPPVSTDEPRPSEASDGAAGEAADEAPRDGALTTAPVSDAVEVDRVAASTGLADLLRLPSAAGAALTDLPQVAVVEELSGQLLALASPTELRRAATCQRPACRAGRAACTHPPDGAGLGPPSPAKGYRPTEAQQRFLRARDRRCRFPGCRAPSARCDLDHNTVWPAGATSCDNLCCLCRHHHRLSHQAPGWTMTRLPDGGLRWTTPSGDTVTTHPPRYGSDHDLPPPPGSAPFTLRERVLGRPAEPGDQSAPF